MNEWMKLCGNVSCKVSLSLSLSSRRRRLTCWPPGAPWVSEAKLGATRAGMSSVRGLMCSSSVVYDCSVGVWHSDVAFRCRVVLTFKTHCACSPLAEQGPGN